ncbi:SAM domain (Sterile alpha motif) [Nesidiocoris tenuis]|uniref:SAM domain (Sterile alpha motif) n=1 Tax=Nesidiocoris tenuis TaxID=355587 RepID=A0ABN7BGB1_9HEMI|nr:SAM domain (Sterile alpha motif) [Nesidiocoris tenuis]
MTKKNRFESSDGDVTYLSYGEAVDDDAVLLNGNGCRRSVVVNGGVSLIRSRSESNLSIASSVFPSRIGGRHVAAPLAVAVAPTNTLHKCLRVLGGSWKNLFHLGGMSRAAKPPQAKKVAPPAVPGDTAPFRNSGSSFGSAGYSSAGEDVLFHDNRDGYEISDGIYSLGPGKSPNTYPYPPFTFPGPQQYSAAGSKSAAYYHQLSLQEDQGIDMTQSPGRDSPGSSGSGSRHSTVSLDSGRASCAMSSHHHRPSLSSSSVGSGESAAPARVERMLQQGVPDPEILHTWLTDLHFDEYFPLFINAGYDMHTISRMTPEDLTAIGIKKPNHRKKLKAEIALLNISDGLPDYIPGSLNEWLRLLRLEEYAAALRSQGYTTVEDTTQITWEDLEDIGIVKLGHQKRMLLAIKRIQDLRAGKTFPPTPFTPTHVDAGDPFVDCDCPRIHSSYKSFHQPWEIEGTPHHLFYTTDLVPIKIRGVRGKSLESLEGGEVDCNGGIVGRILPAGGTSSFTGPLGTNGLGSYLNTAGSRRCFEDGDITPTNEVFPMHQGGGTLPRPRALLKARPNQSKPPIHCYSHDVDQSGGTLKRPGPVPPVRTSSECSSQSVTVVADLHCPQQYNGSDASFKSSSSTESDSIPFANENAGTIKQRAGNRNPNDFIPAVRLQPPDSSTSTSLLPSRKPNQEPVDVLNDIGNMLANLTDELDAMLEEEKRQGLTDD